MKQTSVASQEYAGKKRSTRREKFLGEMQQVVPWSALIALIEPHYPSSGRVARFSCIAEFECRWYSAVTG